MQLARREFLGGGAALLAGIAATRPSPAVAATCRGCPRVRFGVLTDTHIGTEWMMGINSAACEKALRDFKSQGVDAVAVLGDIANNGKIGQLEEFARIWNEVFPGGTGENGKKVEKLFIAGNHDVASWRKYEEQDPEVYIAPTIGKVWERCFNEPYVPVWRKEINGFQFVGMNWGFYPKGVKEPVYSREKLAPVLAEAYRLTPAGQPVFHFRHAPPAGTCWGSGKGAFGTAEALYGEDERLMVFTGHLHAPISHPGSIWQGDYTVVNAGAVTWTCFPGSPYPKHLLSGAVYAKCQETVSVYDGEVVIGRKSIWDGEKMGCDWVIPLPLKKENFPYVASKIAAKAVAPRFPSGAKVAANMAMGENVLQKMRLSFDAAQGNGGVSLSFPPAQIDSESDMVMCYEVSAIGTRNGETIANEKFFTEFYRGPGYISGRCEHLFAAELLKPGEPCRFEVCAVDFFGKKSEAICSDEFTYRRFL